ncbi:Uncharacterized protein T06_11025 [Trichinella sp. T6]|nr:Uncharacterized protein T06_11025 [Trichinella sp. T6]
MDTHLVDIAGVKPYLDDILISGSTKEEHDKWLKEVLQTIKNCVLAMDEVEFLGFRINARGVQLTQDKVKANMVLRDQQYQHRQQLFTAHGLPEVMVSDNAAAFTSNEFQNFMISNAIRHVTISPYHPASNGQAERMVQTMKNALQRRVRGNWNIHFARFLLSQHITLNSKTGLIENAKETRTFHPEQPWIPAIIERQIGLVSYDTRTPEGERHRRHVDQLRTRVDTSEEKIQEKMNEEDRRKEGTEGRSQEERRTEEAEVGDGNTGRITSHIFIANSEIQPASAVLLAIFMETTVPELQLQLSGFFHCTSKEANAWRPCGDYRRLNNITKLDRYPIPNINTYCLFSSLKSCGSC